MEFAQLVTKSFFEAPALASVETYGQDQSFIHSSFGITFDVCRLKMHFDSAPNARAAELILARTSFVSVPSLVM